MVLKGKVLVANTGDDTLTFINLENNKREVLDLKEIIRLNNRKTIRLEGSFIGPYDIVINKEGYVYCTNVYDNSIFKIDLKKKKIVEILAVGSYPTCIKYFNKCLFITNTDSNSISIIDEEKFSLIENIPVGEKPTDIEVDQKNMNLYVVNSNGYSIDLISLEKKEHHNIKLNNNPVKLAIYGDYIYILFNTNNGSINNSNISIVNLKTQEVESSIEFEGVFSNMLKINGSEIIFTTNMDNGYLYRVDIKKKNLLSKTYLKGMPNKLKWNRDEILYISNISTNTLTLFDIESNRVIENIEVGKEPSGILVFH